MSHTDTAGFLLLIALWLTVYLARFPLYELSAELPPVQEDDQSFNRSWYPPNKTEIDDLEAVINGTDVFGLKFSNAYTPPSNATDKRHNWCNMPHVNSGTYPVPPAGYSLEYVEVVGSLLDYLVTRENIIAQSF